jgi:HEAT repeat protein
VAKDDSSLSRLFDARARGDTAYLIESLRLEPENACLAAEWLADDGVTEAIPSLTRLLDVADPSARIAAIQALERLGLRESIKARLVEIARTDSDGVRSWATGALGSYRDRDLTPLLVSLLADPSWRVSSAAVLALRKQGDPSALQPLRLARRSLYRSPARFYLYRRLYSDAIKALRRSGAG